MESRQCNNSVMMVMSKAMMDAAQHVSLKLTAMTAAHVMAGHGLLSVVCVQQFAGTIYSEEARNATTVTESATMVAVKLAKSKLNAVKVVDVVVGVSLS
jgi:hypothetical protein